MGTPGRNRMFDENFVGLVRDMTEANRKLDALSDDHEFTLDDLDLLESLRRSALSLAQTVEATIETFEGR